MNVLYRRVNVGDSPGEKWHYRKSTMALQNETERVEVLVKENKSLRDQLQGSKDMLQSLTEQVQEVIAVNHAVTVQLEQASDVRKYLGKINGEFSNTVTDCRQLIESLGVEKKKSRGRVSSAPAEEHFHADLKKLHTRNLELEKENAELIKKQAKQKSQMLKQDRWVKQLSNVVGNLSAKLDEKGERVQELIELQLATTRKLHESEHTLGQLSRTNQELFTKLKHAMCSTIGTDDRLPEGGDLAQKALGENMQLKADLAIAQEQLKKAYERKQEDEDVAKLRSRNGELEERLVKLDRLRKATNERAHELAIEKQKLQERVQSQKETILGLRRQVASGTVDTLRLPDGNRRDSFESSR
eukprot:jgi/Bigna1/91699/estExt_fgenesh1_pg.C_1140012